MMTSDTQQGAAVGKFMVQSLKAKKVAIIDDRTAYGQGLADEVEKAVKAAGGRSCAASTPPTRPTTSRPS